MANSKYYGNSQPAFMPLFGQLRNNAVNRFLASYEIFIVISHFNRTKACPEHSRRVNPPKAVNEVEKSVLLIDSSAPYPRCCLRQEDAGALRSE
jgi:hypothetical protein